MNKIIKIQNKSLQNNKHHILCKLERNIPKGIIVYYPLVSILKGSSSDKKAFDSFLFFFFLKKKEIQNASFLLVPSVLLSHCSNFSGNSAFFGTSLGRVGQKKRGEFNESDSDFSLKLEHKTAINIKTAFGKFSCEAASQKSFKNIFHSTCRKTTRLKTIKIDVN